MHALRKQQFSKVKQMNGKFSKISNTKKERTPKTSPVKQTEVTNFAKGGNLTASLCKIGYFPRRIFAIILLEI